MANAEHCLLILIPANLLLGDIYIYILVHPVIEGSMYSFDLAMECWMEESRFQFGIRILISRNVSLDKLSTDTK